jgi:hypothetical protein
VDGREHRKIPAKVLEKAPTRIVRKSLVPPPKVGKLQETLHAKAKRAPTYRFCALYDKVYRMDVLWHAYQGREKGSGAFLRSSYTKKAPDPLSLPIEEAFEEWLGDKGEIIGGGGAPDGSWSHIDIHLFELGVDDVPGTLETTRELLRKFGVPQNSTVVFKDDDDKRIGEYPVYS